MEGPIFSEALLKYTTEHLVSYDSFDRFREHCVAWIPAKFFESVLGNQLNTFKLERLRETLSKTKPFEKVGLPILSVDCYTGEIKLQEGNHRVHVLINDLKADRIPVEIIFLETFLEEDTLNTKRIDCFHATLLKKLDEQHLNTKHQWYRKEVWRACAYYVVEEYIL
jgi:hypothetical protein